MRVVFPALLDEFACAETECACRASLRAASIAVAGDKFPFRLAEQAMVAGATLLAAAGDGPVNAGGGAGYGDYPIMAVQTPGGVELTFATLCPSVRVLLAGNEEPVSLARSEGGWRVPLHVFRHQDGLKEVRLTPRRLVPWPEFAAMRDVLLDLISDPAHPLLARLAQVAGVVDSAIAERNLLAQAPPLTARGFLAFRGFVESRAASAEPEKMARFATATVLLHVESTEIGAEQMPALAEALAGDWRGHFRTWLVPAERDISAAIEAYLGSRLFSIPLDRDQSLARGYTEFFEAFAVGLRIAAAMGEVRQALVDVDIAVAALAIAEHMVSAAAEPLPVFEMPRDSHERGPRMADLDMTLESIC